MFNLRKYAEYLIYLVAILSLTGCAAIQPAVAPLVDGEVFNLYSGTATWLAHEGDIMVRTFYNANTGIIVYTRPIADGWAIACESGKTCQDIVGYFVNPATYVAFRSWLTGTGGFVEIARSLPPTPTFTILVIPAVMAQPGFAEGMAMRAAGLAVESDSGDYMGIASQHFDAEWEAMP